MLNYKGNISDKGRSLLNWLSQSFLHGLNVFLTSLEAESSMFGEDPLPGSQIVFLYVKEFSEFSFIRALTSFMSLPHIQLPKAPTLNNITLEVRFPHMHLGG